MGCCEFCASKLVATRAKPALSVRNVVRFPPVLDKNFTRGRETLVRNTPLVPGVKKAGGKPLPKNQASDQNSYSSMTAATATFPFGLPWSSRTTLPLQWTRMLSVSVISAGNVSVNSIGDPAAIGAST